MVFGNGDRIYISVKCHRERSIVHLLRVRIVNEPAGTTSEAEKLKTFDCGLKAAQEMSSKKLAHD